MSRRIKDWKPGDPPLYGWTGNCYECNEEVDLHHHSYLQSSPESIVCDYCRERIDHKQQKKSAEQIISKIEFHYNEFDERTYVWSDAECDWIGFPTFADGEPDWLNPIAIEDMGFADEQTEKNLRSFLMEFEED